MNSPLLTLGSIFVISVISQVSGDTPRISACQSFLVPIKKGEPCYIHCSMTDLQDDEEIAIVKVGVRYYGWDAQQRYHSMEIEYYNQTAGLNSDLPDRYDISEIAKNEINITLSATLPEDTGDFECWLRKGDEVTRSEQLKIHVYGSLIEQNWERLDESGTVVQRFENNSEITIEYDNIASLAFRATIHEPLYTGSVVVLYCNRIGLLNPMINTAFKQEYPEFLEVEISEAGLITGFTSSVLYYSLDVQHFLIAGTSLSSTVTLDNDILTGFSSTANTVSLHLNVQAVPQVQAGDSCSSSFETLNGGTIVFKCGYASYPEQPSFALQLPGRNERIESGDDEKFDFEVTKSGNADTPYLYNLELTYKNIADEVFGTNKLYAQNQMGESPSYDFTITNRNAGSKPGLPLLVPVISSLIAIASFSTRF